MARAKTLMTVEQFATAVPPNERVELSDGELVRMAPAGFEHGVVVAIITSILQAFVRSQRLGVVVSGETGFQLGEYTLRAPDVGFVSSEQLDGAGMQKGFWPGAPDLAVEAVSPSESASDLRTKVQQFFQAGTKAVWLVFPAQRQVHVYAGPKQITILDAHERLSAAELLPGFSVQVEEFFQ